MRLIVPKIIQSIPLQVIDLCNSVDAVLVLPMLRGVDSTSAFESVGQILHFMKHISAVRLTSLTHLGS